METATTVVGDANVTTIQHPLATIWLGREERREASYFYGGTRLISPEHDDSWATSALLRLMRDESRMKNRLVDRALADGALDGLKSRLPPGFLDSRVGGARCLIRPRNHDIARSLADPLHEANREITHSVLASIGTALNTQQQRIKLTPDFGRYAGLADVLLKYTKNVLGIECARGGCGGKSSYSATGVIAVAEYIARTKPSGRVTCIGSAGAMGTTILEHFRTRKPRFLAACDLVYDSGEVKVPDGCVHLVAQDGQFTDECLSGGGMIVATTVGDELANSSWQHLPAGSTVLLAHNLALPVGGRGIELARALAARDVLVIPGQVLTLGGALTARVEWYWRQMPEQKPFDKPLAHDVVSTTTSYLADTMLRAARAASCTPYEALLRLSAEPSEVS